jgi:hypothetical protein
MIVRSGIARDHLTFFADTEDQSCRNVRPG